jgi:hypothetical protein
MLPRLALEGCAPVPLAAPATWLVVEGEKAGAEVFGYEPGEVAAELAVLAELGMNGAAVPPASWAEPGPAVPAGLACSEGSCGAE